MVFTAHLRWLYKKLYVDCVNSPSHRRRWRGTPPRHRWRTYWEPVTCARRRITDLRLHGRHRRDYRSWATLPRMLQTIPHTCL